MREPNSAECFAGTTIDTPVGEGRACWYPQIGGHAAHAIAVFTRLCWDIYIWHDGEFSFTGERPVEMHHCEAAQFTRFGQLLESWEG